LATKRDAGRSALRDAKHDPRYALAVRGLLFCLALVSAGCSEQLFEPGKGVLVSGQEPDVWSVEPRPTLARVETEKANGDRTTLLERAAPVSEFSFGQGSSTRFVLTGIDDAGTARVRARTVPLSPAGLAGVKIQVFASRTDAFARPPGNLVTALGDEPPFGFVGGRYLLAAGPDGQLDGYDFGVWLPVAAPPPIDCPSPPCTIRSLAVVSTSLALVVGDDWAISLDVDTGQSFQLDRPTGLAAWADVAGGQTVIASDGSSYVVGATRSDPPTRAVLRVAPDGKLSALSLIAARHGAAAAWLDGRGLVVVGGDDQAAGAELVGDAASAALPFPPDPTTGAALVASAEGNVVRAGGRDASGAFAETAVFPMGCGTDCKLELSGTNAELDGARAFRAPSDVDPDAILVIGSDDQGETAAKLLAATVTPVPLREPRTGASAFLAPTGHIAVVGGTLLDGSPATSLELFIR
jgi:hypothetical protein